MTALSVSISTSTSPRSTRSPMFLSQVRMRPSSMVSERRGMVISGTCGPRVSWSESADRSQRFAACGVERFGGGEGRLLQGFGVGQGDFGGGDAAYRCVEMVEGAIGDRRGDLGADTVGQPIVFGDDGAAGLADGFDNRVAVQRAKAAQVDHLGADAVFIVQPFSDLCGDFGHPRIPDD